ncbi:META domain-containing protein [Flavobacterium sp. KACC 22761]|uniref:META domain-containing protein n=1 Tax=Flavobacterium sp. KACC 22761 TaxID=3092665 RepID=UPI002A74F212|nr:META domain-containing protein [Flavobacterium sp. KACC 22761]WPO78706.1 META domain-containing protein [Flavobacterium sp. KACC 22761]
MKKSFVLLIVAFIVCGCKTAKNTNLHATSLVIDKKLLQTWVLNELNGKTVQRSEFQNKIPKITIGNTLQTFKGNTGCNEINGNVFYYRKDEIQFLNINVETNKCPVSRKEDEFLKLLKTTSNYSIIDNKLVLSDRFDAILVFTKG